MEHDIIDLTCSDSPDGGSPRPHIKRSRSKVPSRSFHLSREGSSSSSTLCSQGPSNVSQEALASSTASDSASSAHALPRRYPGDGLDFRRPANLNPAMNSQPSNLIDLTLSDDGEDDDDDEGDEQPMTIEDDGEDNNGIQGHGEEDDDDDLQITSVHSRIPRLPTPWEHEPPPSPHWRLQPSHRPTPRGPRFARSIMNDAPENQEIPTSHVRSTRRHAYHRPTLPSHPRTLPPLPSLRPPPQGPRQVIDMTGDRDDHAQQLPPLSQNYYPPPGRVPTAPSHISHALALWRTVRNHAPASLTFLGPAVMDYTRTAFNVATPGAGSSPQPPSSNVPASPPLEPLPPVPDGFTRSPREGNVLICPFCRNELCSGDGDGDSRSQVWVVKACGHVYCGMCASKRPRQRGGKGSKKPAGGQFTTCVVDGCNSKVGSAKAMYQLFL